MLSCAAITAVVPCTNPSLQANPEPFVSRVLATDLQASIPSPAVPVEPRFRCSHGSAETANTRHQRCRLCLMVTTTQYEVWRIKKSLNTGKCKSSMPQHSVFVVCACLRGSSHAEHTDRTWARHNWGVARQVWVCVCVCGNDIIIIIMSSCRFCSRMVDPLSTRRPSTSYGPPHVGVFEAFGGGGGGGASDLRSTIRSIFSISWGAVRSGTSDPLGSDCLVPRVCTAQSPTLRGG